MNWVFVQRLFPSMLKFVFEIFLDKLIKSEEKSFEYNSK